MKHLSKEISIETIKRFFSNNPNEDVVSVNDAFLASGRDTAKMKENKDWLSNKLTHLKYHDLVKPIYSYTNGYRTLDKLQLTMAGKRALGRIESDYANNGINTATTGNGNPPSLTDLMKTVAKLRKENPDYEMTYPRLRSWVSIIN